MTRHDGSVHTARGRSVGRMCGIALELIVGAAGPAKAACQRRRAAAAAALRRRGPDAIAEHHVGGASSSSEGSFELWLAGAVLSLRGHELVRQPLIDAHGNALLWNGEIFGGAIAVPPGVSDTMRLLSALAAAPSVPDLMRQIHGPWAFAYWHAASRTLWHGRDALGRRSLLRACPSHSSSGDEGVVLRLCSVAVQCGGETEATTWAELPADGIGCARICDGGAVELSWHASPPLPPPAPLPVALLTPDSGDDTVGRQFWEAAVRDGQMAAARLLVALSEAVRRRVSGVPPSPPTHVAPTTPSIERDATPEAPPLATSRARVGVLFSGGIDCMVIARLADLHLPPDEPLDLINVAFGTLAAEAPDRLTAAAGVAELRRLSPRTFHLIEVDVTLAELQASRSHLLSLLAPACTVMDMNIGAALWFGSRAWGRLRAPRAASHLSPSSESHGTPLMRYADASGRGLAEASKGDASHLHPQPPLLEARVRLQQGGLAVKLRVDADDSDGEEGEEREEEGGARCIRQGGYRSGARVLLLGGGADELFGGYGRHRTVWRKEGWTGLAAELRAERERLWLRNLGRDDRVVSDWGREARHPYLDEGVLATLAETPLHLICDLRWPLGCGDKIILRRLARMLGLTEASCLQKRAIQFGTRIANKSVCGQAVLDETIDLREVVHPDAEADASRPAATSTSTRRNGRGHTIGRGTAERTCLSKKHGTWASARAAPPTNSAAAFSVNV